MLNTLPALPALPAMAASSAPPAAQANAGAKSETRAFARELERARPKDDAPAPQANVNSQTHPGRSPPAKAAHVSDGTAQPAHGKAAATTARSRAEPAPSQSADVAESAADLRDNQAGKSLESEDANAATVATAAAAADLSSLLASLMAPATVPSVAAHGAARAAVEADGRVLGPRHRESAKETDDPRMAAPVDAALAPSTIAAEADTGTGGHGSMREDAAEHAPTTGASRTEAAVFALPQPTAAMPSPLGRTEAAAPAPYAAQIAAPVGSPEFAPGLSAQLSVMVRDGLQEARLQLNPAEMGPITVQIQLDGHKAQVTLVAEQAPTRQALEQAMPTLAGALREEGLTLTGGGVFEQAPPNAQQQQQQQAQRDAALSRRGGGLRGGDDDPQAQPAAPAARAGGGRGVLDVYA